MYYCSTPLACSSALSTVVVEGPDLSRQAAPAGRLLTRRCSVRVPDQPRWGAGPDLGSVAPEPPCSQGTGLLRGPEDACPSSWQCLASLYSSLCFSTSSCLLRKPRCFRYEALECFMLLFSKTYALYFPSSFAKCIHNFSPIK